MARKFQLFGRKSQVITTIKPTFYPVDFVHNFLSGGISATELELLHYYLTVPELSAIINYRGRTFAGMTVKMRNARTGEEVESHPILEMLRQPNPMQSFADFAKQYSISKDVFGNGYIHPVYGVDISNTKELYNLPGLNSRIIPQDGIPFNKTEKDEIVKGYEFQFRGDTLTYAPDEVIHFADAKIRYDDENYLKGESKVRALSQACENIVTAYEARGILQGNSPLGVLSNRTTDGAGAPFMDPKETERVQDNLKDYGARKKKYQFIVTSANLDYVSMSQNITNLKLYEEVQADQLAVANAYGFPVELVQNEVTYENKKEAKKQLYQDTIIPEAEEWLQGLSRDLGLYDKNLELYPDYSHVQVLQEDMERKARTWNTTTMALNRSFQDGALSIDEYRDNLQKLGML